MSWASCFQISLGMLNRLQCRYLDRFFGGVVAGADADGDGEENRECGEPPGDDGDLRAILGEEIHGKGQGKAEDRAGHASNQADQSGFDQDGISDVEDEAAKRFHDADLDGALRYGHDHGVGNADGGNER